MKYKVGDVLRTTPAWSIKSTGEVEVLELRYNGYLVKVLKAVPYKNMSVNSGAWFVKGNTTNAMNLDGDFFELIQSNAAPVAERDVIGELDEDQKRILADLAIKTATDLGYCSETENVLRAMGLSNKQRHKVVIEFEIEAPYGTEITKDMLQNIYPENTNYNDNILIVEDEYECLVYSTKLVDKQV